MKTTIMSLILLIGTIASADTYVGRVGVGTPRGALCKLKIIQLGQDFNDKPTFTAEFSKSRLVSENKEIIYFKQEFPLQTYGDSLQGSVQFVSSRRVPLKGTMTFFYDQRTNSHKVILHENTLNPTSVGRHTVCDGMILQGR